MNETIRSCIDLAQLMNQLAESEEWQFFDEGLSGYLEEIYALEQEMMSFSKKIDSEALHLIQRLHDMILNHALKRREQLEGELLLLHKNKQAASFYQNY